MNEKALIQPWYQWEGKDLLLVIQVQPRARQDEIVGFHGNSLKIRLTAAPIDGQANQHLLRFLADIFKVPKTHITLVSGAAGRMKRIRITAPRLVPEQLRNFGLY
ncbi:conserved hypothetical protein [Gammaproteobacteria bacterium]